MHKTILVWLLVFLPGYILAQLPVIKGEVRSREGALPSATVSLLGVRDSVLFKATSTDTAGFFQLKGLKKGVFFLRVSFVGYEDHIRRVSLHADTLRVGRVFLKPSVTELAEIEVVAERDRIQVREDTVEYNARAFQTPANSELRQLLLRLPGVQVRSDGTITVNGEIVRSITINGREFFGGNTAVALEHLPAEAVDRVQVLDEKSEEARFTGISDNSGAKVINLTLGGEDQKLTFGKITAGAGTSDRYSADGNFHLFNNDRQVSIIGSSNNINNADATTGAAEDAAMQGGQASNYSGGLNVLTKMGRNASVTASYQPGYSASFLDEETFRETFLPNGTLRLKEFNTTKSTNNSHPVTLGIELKGKRSNIRLNASANLSTVNSNSWIDRRITALDSGNQVQRQVNSHFENRLANATLFYGYRFRKKGRSLMLTGQYNLSRTQQRGLSDATLGSPDGPQENELLQRSNDTNVYGFGSKVTYTEPLGRKQSLQLHYNLSHRENKTDQSTIDRVLNVEDPFQSNGFHSAFTHHSYGVTYRFRGKSLNIAVGSDWQESFLEGAVKVTDAQISRHYQYLLPRFSFLVKSSRKGRFNLDYSTSINEPSVQQLQPVLTGFDPMNIIVGNPDLDPEYNHSGRINYKRNFRGGDLFLMAGVMYNYQLNTITPATRYDENLIATTTYRNIDGNSRLNANLTIGFPIKGINSDFAFEPYASRSDNISYVNGQPNRIETLEWGGNVSWRFHYKDEAELRVESSVAFTNYSFENNAQPGGDFLTSLSNVYSRVRLLRQLFFVTGLSVVSTADADLNQARTLPFLNLALTRYLFRNRQGQITLSGNNVLGYGSGPRQLLTPLYVERSRRNILGEWYMLSFSYHFK